MHDVPPGTVQRSLYALSIEPTQPTEHPKASNRNAYSQHSSCCTRSFLPRAGWKARLRARPLDNGTKWTTFVLSCNSDYSFFYHCLNQTVHATSPATHSMKNAKTEKKNAKRNGHRVLAGQLEMPREPPRLFLSQSLKNFFFFVFVVFQHEQRSNKQTNKQTDEQTQNHSWPVVK